MTRQRMVIDKAVFFPALGALLLLVAFAGLFPETSETSFQAVQTGIVHYASWYYVLVVAIILVSVLYFALSRFGSIKLGPDHSEPEYSNLSWFSMLFAAGMGIGLMFFGVAEPVMHFMSPPEGPGGTAEAASEAMRLTFFHWGLHAWAIYAIVALLLAYFAYRHNLPLTMRSAFYPLIGERIYGPWGAAVDVFAIVCTTCGIATSLGLGIVQINSGLNYLWGVPINSGVQVILILCTMALASISVLVGLDAGIKRLSELNISVSILLLLCVLIAGPTVVVLQATLQNLGDYLGEIVSKTTNLYAYNPNDWLGGWTIFYWGWWLSWAPFVGLFIARVSRGRTIREFVLGAMLIPGAYTLLWMGIFGNSAIELILNEGMTELGTAVQENQAVALFRFLEFLPMSTLLSTGSLVMVVIFFVTSADSGALVLNVLSARGEDNTPALQRMIWTGVIALTSIVLLLAGGLSALQTAAIASALPFSIALLLATWGFAKALSADAAKRDVTIVQPHVTDTRDWRKRLRNIMLMSEEEQVKKFLQETVIPAMREFGDELRQFDIEYQINDQHDSLGRVRLELMNGDEPDFVYEVRNREHPMPAADAHGFADNDSEATFHRAEVHLMEGGQDYCIMGWSREQVAMDVLNQYSQHVQFLKSIV